MTDPARLPADASFQGYAEGSAIGRTKPSASEAIARVLSSLDAWLFGLPFARFCVLVFAVVVLQNGIWIVPIIGRICHLSSDLTRQLTQDNRYFDYLYNSFLELMVGHWTGAWKSGPVFAGLHLAILCVGLIGLLWGVYRKFGDQTARLFLLAFATVPVSNILLTWLGQPDVYTFIFSTALVLTEGAPLIALLAFLLGLAHFEQGLVIVSGLAVCKVYSTVRAGRPWRAAAVPVAALLGGVFAAHEGLAWYLASHNFHLATTRVSAVTGSPWGDFLSRDARHLGTLIFSLHECYWLVVVGLTLSLWHARRGLALGVVGLQLVFVGITMLTLDETRVFSLLAWPFLVFLLRPDVVPNEQIRRCVVCAYAGGLLIPRLVVWDGNVHSSALYSGLVLFGRLVSGQGIMSDPNWMMLPFK